jgi:hypothetical protein
MRMVIRRLEVMGLMVSRVEVLRMVMSSVEVLRMVMRRVEVVTEMMSMFLNSIEVMGRLEVTKKQRIIKYKGL